MNKKFDRSFGALEHVFEFIERFFVAEAIDRSLQHTVEFAVEELFTNMVKYSPGTGEEIELNLEPIQGGVQVSIIDHDVEPFDPTKAAEVDIDRPIEEREPGGLGLHLIRKLVDSMDYEYKERQSKITFTAKLGAQDVRD